MLEGTGRLLLKIPQERIIGVAQFPQTGIGHKPEHLLKQVDKRISSHDEHGAYEQEQHSLVRIIAHLTDATEGEVGDQQTDKHDDGSDELLPSLVEVLKGKHRYHTGHDEHDE